MSESGAPSTQTSADGEQRARSTRRRDATAVAEVCPYIADDAGAWRSAYAAREHRCHAVNPPAQLAISKQRQLCLVADHVRCATYVAARAVVEESVPAAPGDDGAALWPTTVSTPVVLEPARRMGAIPGATAKGGGQALLVALMVLAFLVLVIARTQSPAATGGATAAPSSGASSPAVLTPSPAAPSTPAPTADVTATPEATPEATEAPRPTAKPTPKPTTAATRTYRVKSGDTLSGIAVRFGTTVKVLQRLNDIADPRVIRIGQVLVIP